MVSGSHAGVVTASIAMSLGCAALIAHDAAVGLGGAGIAALGLLDDFQIPCCAIDSSSAPIGDVQRSAAYGSVSYVNESAGALGVSAGWSVRRATDQLQHAHFPAVRAGAIARAAPRRLDVEGHREVWLLGSASEVSKAHAGAIVVTGSHAALIGTSGGPIVSSGVFGAVFNDAGGNATRLPALDAQGIAAVAVGAATARIGDAESSYRTGVITVTNAASRRMGARVGMSAQEFVSRLATVGHVT